MAAARWHRNNATAFTTAATVRRTPVGHQGRGMDILGLMSAIEAARGDNACGLRLPPAQWQQLAGALERRALDAGSTLLRRGDVDACAYFVESGCLQVFVTGGPPSSHRIATLGAGAVIGEPGLFAAVPRMANVEAMTSCVVWALPAQRLHAMAAEAPALVLAVLCAAGAVMARRMRANLERGIPAP